MNMYMEMKKKHQEEISSFPMEFACDEKQFKEAMKNLGLTENDRDKVASLYGCGDIMRKEDIPKLIALGEKHWAEMEEKIAEDKTGDGFIFDMFDTELANHEYGYTQDPSDAIEALGLTPEIIRGNKAMLHGFKRACKEQRDRYSNQMKG